MTLQTAPLFLRNSARPRTVAAQAPSLAPSPSPAAAPLAPKGVDRFYKVGAAVAVAVAVAPSSSRDAVTAQERAAYAALNAKVLKKYPSLAPVLTDPDAFTATMRARFAEQKRIAGADPYGFDFSEWGVPALQSMKEALDDKIAALDPLLARLLPTQQEKVEQHVEVARLLDEMRADIDGLLAAQQRDGAPLPYRRVQEISFYAARTIGLLDLPKLHWRDRALLEVDRYLQGYEHASIAAEARRYHANEFSVFQKHSPVAGFAAAEEAFERAFFNPDALELIALPTIDSLGPEPFTRLVPYDLFLFGVTPEPAAADGFVRPGGDFYIHDVRHSSAIFHKRREYEREHGVTPAQSEKLAKRGDLWKVELDAARAAVDDKELRAAIGFFMFNFHHDRGYPMLPSSYLSEDANNRVPKLLYAMLKISGQPVGFGDVAVMNKAHGWLKTFWLARLDEERAILTRK